MNEFERMKMADSEKWTRWEPISGLIHSHYYTKSITDNHDGFKLVLINEDNENYAVQIFFTSIEAYRRTNESYQLETISNLDHEYGSSFFGPWTFFKIEDSSYVQWLQNEICGSTDNLPFIHFCFITVDFFFDIVTVHEPKVTLINLTENEKTT